MELADNTPLAVIAEIGYLGVDFFFVLSGFVIHHSSRGALMSGEFSFSAFVRNRVFRIYPVHILVLLGLAFLPLALLLFSSSRNIPDYYSVDYFIYSIFLVQSWGVPIELKWNTPAWSVSCEVFAYILYAIICFLIGLFWKKKFDSAHERVYLQGVLAAVVALGLMVGLAIRFEAEGASGLGDKIEWLGLFRCVVEFSIGVVLAQGLRSGVMVCSIYLSACIAVLVVLVSNVQIENFYYAPVVISAVILVVSRLEISHSLKPIWMMRSLGEWSYSTYIVHYPVKLWVVAFDLSALFGVWYALGVYIGLTLGLSIIIYYFIEMPCVRFGRRMPSSMGRSL